ncbi:MAG TPA: hypothetical protein VJ508_15535 [Saprospiraceae bacterium]|nr:hypothetical protein [Saprospiraceae bacterium]
MNRILTLLFASLLITLGTIPVMASTPHHSMAQLHKEVSDVFRQQDLSFLKDDVATVTVNFVINPKNEIVVFGVTGDDDDACKYVKDKLNFKKVNYIQSRQLTRYVVNIRLVKS